MVVPGSRTGWRTTKLSESGLWELTWLLTSKQAIRPCWTRPATEPSCSTGNRIDPNSMYHFPTNCQLVVIQSVSTDLFKTSIRSYMSNCLFHSFQMQITEQHVLAWRSFFLWHPTGRVGCRIQKGTGAKSLLFWNRCICYMVLIDDNI